MQNDKSIAVLNTLIEINNDRIEGYRTAFRQTNEEDLRSLFSRLGRTSQKCKAELVQEVNRLGGTPIQGTRNTGKVFRLWMDLKLTLTGKDRNAILDSCEYGEDVTTNIYNTAIIERTNVLTIIQKKMISDQCRMITSDHDKIKQERYTVLLDK